MSTLYLACKSYKLESCKAVISDLFPLHQQFSEENNHILDIAEVQSLHQLCPSTACKCMALGHYFPLITLQAHQPLTFCSLHSILIFEIGRNLGNHLGPNPKAHPCVNNRFFSKIVLYLSEIILFSDCLQH